MHIHTRLPFKHMMFRHWNHLGEEMGVVVVKAGLQITEGAVANELLQDQPDLLLTDIFAGEVNVSPLIAESDLAPFKPKTDITINAVARSPDAKELDSWPVSINVANELSYGFHVFGPRYWEPHRTLGRRTWQLSSLGSQVSLPLTYDYAYGGAALIRDDESIVHPFNPIGRGILSDFMLEQDLAIPAAQIGLLGELSSPKPNREMTVCGLAPIQKSWQPRLALAGTFDDAWKRERHPRMPKDYNFAYWNAAPLPLQTSSYLKGDETIELNGLRHEPAPYVFQLPAIKLLLSVRRGEDGQKSDHLMHLDTVHIDVADKAQSRHSLSLTWRLCLDDPDDIQEIELTAKRLEGRSS